MDALTKESLANAEVILNRTNIALARSRKLIQSWMSTPPTEQQATEQDEDDFKAESEFTGLGSTKTEDGEGSALMSAVKRPGAKNEKLLKQLLGTKGAKQHLQQQKAQKAAESKPTQLVAPKKPSNQAASSDEDEPGRTSMLSRPRTKQKPAQADTGDSSDDSDAANQTMSLSQKSGKRKANSYLDELLSQKSNKKRQRTKGSAA